MAEHIDESLREAMRESFARVGRERCTEAFVRVQMETPDAHDEQMWAELAGLGLTALLVPDDYGGLGGGPLEAEAIMEEAGKMLLPGPFFSSAIIATALIAGASDAPAKARLLPALADGSKIAAVALAGRDAKWTGTDLEIDAGRRLSGTAPYVSDAGAANSLLVIVRQGGQRMLYEVTDAEGLTTEPIRCIDRTQRLSNLRFDKVRATPIDCSDGAIEAALAMATVALLGRQAGAAERNFNITIDYLRTRVQFGRTIGGFQALKHIAADLVVELESAKTAARHAAERLAEGRGDAPAAIAMAGFLVSDAQSRIAAESIQLHGGIGFTWEHSAHLYLRRAQFDALFLGSPDSQREQFLALMECAE